MIALLSDISLFLAGLAAIVATLDFFLDDKEKARIGNGILSAWYFVSNVSWHRTIALYQTQEFFRQAFLYSGPLTILLIGLLSVVGVLGDAYSRGRGGISLDEAFISAIVLGALFGAIALATFFVNRFIFYSAILSKPARIIYFWSVEGTSKLVLFAKGILCLLVALVVQFLLGVVNEELRIDPLGSQIFSLGCAWLLLPFTTGFALSSMLVIRVAVSTILSVPVWILERVLRRISEYERGPVLGVSVFLAAVGLFLKTL